MGRGLKGRNTHITKDHCVELTPHTEEAQRMVSEPSRRV